MRVIGWVLIACLLLAPWCQAVTEPRLEQGLACLELGLALMLGISLVAAGRRPALNWLCIGSSMGIVLIGLISILNPRSRYDGDRDAFFPESGWISIVPASVDSRVAVDATLKAAGFLSVVLITAELARRAAWERTLLVAIGMSGAAIAAAGFLEKYGFMPTLGTNAEHPSSVFATFPFHGIAGVFLNICLPVTLTMALATARSHASAAYLWIGAGVLIFAGLCVNISRAAMLVGVVQLILFGSWLLLAKLGPVRGRGMRQRGKWIGMGLTVLLGCVLSVGVMRSEIWGRWQEFPSIATSKNGRLLMWRVCLGMIGDGGLWGTGPGSFKVLISHTPHMIRDLYPRWIVQPYKPGTVVAPWNYANNDYLQAVVEWGWIGAAFWAIVIIGAWLRAGRSLLRQRRHPVEWQTNVTLACFMAIGSALCLAMIEFPFQQACLQLYLGVLIGLAWRPITTRMEPVPAANQRVAMDGAQYELRDPDEEGPVYLDD